jgi:4-hydroxyacetophenone monooxygenase
MSGNRTTVAATKAGLFPELLEASDELIEDAVLHGDPMVLRGLLYQLTGDAELKTMAMQPVTVGFSDRLVPAGDAEIAMVRRKAADFLKKHRDSGAGPIGFGPAERLNESMDLAAGVPIPDEDRGMALEELALDPWARSLKWRSRPHPDRLKGFSVTVIGTGMGGLNAALQLKRAGINYEVFEKNAGVGGTWTENRYPGARVDSPSRIYSHIYGVDFPCPYNFGPQSQNQSYFDWIADEFGLRGDITFNTEATALTWDDAEAMWEIELVGPDGKRTHRSNVVITAVGFLNRPNIPEIEGVETFGGLSWHTSRWPDGFDPRGKRIAVIGTGCTGYQLVPELAREAAHVTIFQRTPGWLIPLPGYLARVPDQLLWLDRNMPYHTNFMRFRTAYGMCEDFIKMTEIDPNFEDPHSCSPTGKRLRDQAIEALKAKLGDPKLVEIMTPTHPVWSARPIMCDVDYNILDALNLDNVSLVTDGIRRLNPAGIEASDGSQHEVDVIVYATGFKANEYLYPMKISGRGGLALDELWAADGPRAYIGGTMPGFPNLWAIYGPNTNGSLQVAAFHELTMLYAMQCIEELILGRKRSIEVKEEAFWRYSHMLDERNKMRAWSDPRAHNYYWAGGRSPGMNPFPGTENWRYLSRPDFADLDVR